ncbi:hypothetical protein FF80_03273 [Devosia sp. LC5]|uniref:hypothetical protein n=1 Tax=Devosia sp. LC5 TaxID=1502724 RepID=UPI0004E36603|nr:hypothetical protein [Devosia sp. LC5]KFC62707.1 hypothetical protein FF80_03273 [Devosia sp. LC5]
MASGYAWTDDEDHVAADAVTVSIGSDTRILKIAGLEFGTASAWVYWPGTMHHGEHIEPRAEGPFDDVGVALDYAAQMSALYGFNRVVVALQDEALWRDSWGELGSRLDIH